MRPFSEFNLPDAQSLRGLAPVLRIALTIPPSLRKALELFPTQGFYRTLVDALLHYVRFGMLSLLRNPESSLFFVAAHALLRLVLEHSLLRIVFLTARVVTGGPA